MDLKKLQNGSDIRGIALEGIEGEVPNLKESETRALTAGFVMWLASKTGKSFENMSVAVGMDARLSGQCLKDIILDVFTSFGIKTFDCGLASTPAMFMSTVLPQYTCDGSVMITASHLPFNRNGFKYFDKNGGLDKKDIIQIIDFAETLATKDKNLNLAKTQVITSPLMDAYSKHLCNLIIEGIDDGDKPLKDMKIIVDAGNGNGGFFATKVLAQLGADISDSQFLEPDGNFPNHAPNPEDKEAMASICKQVKEKGADLGLIFDTDVDRSAAVDGNGNPIARNEIVALAAALIADTYPNSTVVTDSITSDQLTEFIEKDLGLKHLRYMRGYKNVINKGIELNAQCTECHLAIETSGHAAFKENYFLDDGAYLATLIVIRATKLKKEGKDISSLISDLKHPAEAKEIRMRLRIDDFKKYGDNVIEWVKAWVNAEDCIGEQTDPNDPSSPCEKCHCGTNLAEPNFEGVRINFDKENGNGWALLRMSLHDPIMPLNIESNDIGGVEIISKKLKAFLKQYTALDTRQL